MIRLLSSLLLAVALAAAAPMARAFTPESGWWWNPNEPGYGFAIEIQDDYVFMVVFSYTGGGDATWYAAQGTMQNNAVFLNQLYSAEGGTCLGCSYSESTAFAIGGPIDVEFLTESTAEVTVAGRTIPIQRHNFRLSYGSDASPRTGLWRGEWHATLDFSAIPQARALPYFGEVVVIDQTVTRSGVAYFEGCRPETSMVGTCSNAALNTHGVSGFYSPSDGTYFMFVEDEGVSQQWPAGSFLVYEVEANLNSFRGTAKRCHRDETDFLRNCIDNNNIAKLPVRGWRSASRAFVDGDDNAPSAQPAAPTEGKAAAASPWRDFPNTVDATADQPKSERADPAATAALLRAAVERLNAQR